MKTLRTIHHKKNELFEVEFYQDKECTQAFDFTNVKDLYIELKDGDVSPITAINNMLIPCVRNERSGLYKHPKIYTGYMPNGFSFCDTYFKIYTLNDITPNLSKYIPEDNAVLFLSEEEYRKYCNQFKPTKLIGWLDNTDFDYKDWFQKYNIKTATIFLTHGTQSELQKANEVAKYLWENFGIKPDLCVLHWFGSKYEVNAFEIEYLCEDFGVLSNINKIITINSTGILKPEDSTERFQVIDAKEIFEEYLNK